jgi:L-threonylcarbamoyladenylate synthase
LSDSIIKNIQQALMLIKAGTPIAIPTETVYGLAASIDNPLAIRQIFAIKGRPVNHPLIIHVSCLEMAEEYAYFTEEARTLAKRFWPGPLTMILPKKDTVPFEVTGGLSSVAIRSPNHSLTLQLISQNGTPFAAPSANRFGKISPTTAKHIIDDYDGRVLVLDGGQCIVGVESTIIDLTTSTAAIRRYGSVLEEELEHIVGKLGKSDTITSGTLQAHYAPSTSLLLSCNAIEDSVKMKDKGLTVETLNITDPENYAQQLYAELRRLDKLGVDILIASKPPNQGIGKAVIDRLTKASFGSNNTSE